MDKLRTDISVNSGLTVETSSRLTGETRASVTLEKRIPKINKKYLAMYPPIKDPIPNQDKNTLRLQIKQCCPSGVPPFSSGIKSLRNKKNCDNPENIDTSRTDKDDTAHTS